MSTPSVSGTRICPECGKQNSGLSLFCAECGTPLSEDAEWARRDDGQTTSTVSPAQDPEATTAFTPVATTAPESRTDTGWVPPSSTDTWSATTPEPSPAVQIEVVSEPESRRGFVLGVIAAILIVVVICFVIWSSLFGEATRDMITGWFGWIG